MARSNRQAKMAMEQDNEKADVKYVTDTEQPDDLGFSEAEKLRITRRVDRRLVVTVGLMYCISLVDRTNMSAAAVAGMIEELKLYVNGRYGVATLVFFVTYIVFQPPSTVIIRKIGPRLHLSSITLLWGAVMIGMGFVQNFESLAALRVILGLLEAGFFPSCVYLLSTWYTRYEVGKRYAVFYLLGCMAAAFSGILAYGLMHMGGLANITGWRWIFIMEGVITCILAIAGYWLLVSFPDQEGSWRFLGKREREYIMAKVNADRGDVATPPFSLVRFLKAGADWKIWAYALMFFNTTTVTYSLAYFLPIILSENMGFDAGQSQCLVAPPYAFAGLIMYGTGWFGDRYRLRGPVIVFNVVLSLVGLSVMGFHPSMPVRYFGVFLTTAGANSNIPAVMTYQANNIRGQWKRAFCSATLVGFGGIGGIVGSLVFRDEDKPHYSPGMYTCIACQLLTLLLVGLLSIDFYFKNRKADRGETELEMNDDDSQRGFRYTH